jgi:tellurite resistance protein TehA-like permease
MSGMEPEVRDFLKKVAWSVFFAIFWLTLNMTLGIYVGLLFIDDGISIGNILYYIFLAGSLTALIIYYYRVWKNKYPHG